MKYTTLLFVLSIVTFSSCTVVTRLKTSEKYVNRQAEASGSDAKLINKPILADLEVSMERLKSNISVTNKEIGSSSMVLSSQGRSQGGGRSISTVEEYYKNEAKKRAQFQFMSEHKCDYLVDPIYKIDTESKSSSDTMLIKVEILAFPAVYKKFSQPDSLPKCVTQINYADYRGVPLWIGSDEEPKYVSPARGIMSTLGVTQIKNSSYSEAGLGGSLGYFSQRRLVGKLSLRTEFSIITRSNKYQDSYYDPYFNNLGIQGYDSMEIERKNRSVGFQTPVLFSIDGSRLGIYFGPAVNLDFMSISRSRPVGSSSWESYNSSGIEDGGFSLIFGLNIHASDRFSFGYRHDNGSGYAWRSNSLCMSFKLN